MICYITFTYFVHPILFSFPTLIPSFQESSPLLTLMLQAHPMFIRGLLLFPETPSLAISLSLAPPVPSSPSVQTTSTDVSLYILTTVQR